MNDFSKIATELFMQGYSCSESVVKAAYEAGIIDKNIDSNLLNMIASPFSGAMGEHQCICGAIAGSQMVIGLLMGRTDPKNDPNKIKELAIEFNTRMKEKRGKKTLCCKVLKSPLDGRAHCAGIVQDASSILGDILSKAGSKV